MVETREKLAPYIDRCIFSFVEMYRRLENNIPELIPMTEADKERLAEGLGRIARKYAIRIQTCGTNGDYGRYGIHSSGCATLEILGTANHCTFREIKHKGLREGCHCIESRDLGAYDTCLNGCKYCYAIRIQKRRLKIFNIVIPIPPFCSGKSKIRIL